jgi:hypothetical protein
MRLDTETCLYQDYGEASVRGGMDVTVPQTSERFGEQYVLVYFITLIYNSIFNSMVGVRTALLPFQ